MNKKRIIALITALAALVLVLTGCSSKPQSENNKIKIVASTNVYADIAKNVVGKYGDVHAIITKASADPHDFEPTTNDAKMVSGAKLAIANGLGYDSWMGKLAKSTNVKSVRVGEDIMGLKKGANPHIWYNLSMPKQYVTYLVAKLAELDAKHANYFKKNGAKYIAKVAQLQKLATGIDGKNSKPVYVSEPVFDYALESAGYRVADKEFEEAVENETDPSAQTISKMNEGISNKKIAFFVNNTQTSSSTVNNFVKLAKKHGIPILDVRETIPSKTTYLEWMQDNFERLAKVAEK